MLIDMCNMCVHHTVFDQVKFSDACGGDFNFLTNCMNLGLSIKFLNIPIGIWANWEGAKHGKEEDYTYESFTS